MASPLPPTPLGKGETGRILGDLGETGGDRGRPGETGGDRGRLGWAGLGSGTSGRGGEPPFRDTPLEDGDLTRLEPRVVEG